MVFHDAKLGRTTDRRGRVTALTLEELQAVFSSVSVTVSGVCAAASAAVRVRIVRNAAALRCATRFPMCRDIGVILFNGQCLS